MIIKNILIAEDIRQEVGNKISLMGIISNSLNMKIPATVPKEAPINLALAYLVTIENTDLKNDPKDFNISVIITLGDKPLGKVNAKVTSGKDERILHLPVPRLPFAATNTTILTVQAKITKDDKLIHESSAVLNINIERNGE